MIPRACADKVKDRCRAIKVPALTVKASEQLRLRSIRGKENRGLHVPPVIELMPALCYGIERVLIGKRQRLAPAGGELQGTVG